MNLSTAQSCLLARARRACPLPITVQVREDRTAKVLKRAGLLTITGIADGRIHLALTDEGIRLADELGLSWLKSSFAPRDLPEAIWIGEEAIAGPFCVHCGNPLSLHRAEGARCPDRILHPVFPPPSCACHGLTPVAS